MRVVRYAGTKASVSVPGCITVAKKPYSVTEIGDSAFKGCAGISEISMPDTVESIGDSAFEGCTGLSKVLIPKGIKSIRGRAFKGCAGLKKVVMKDSPDSIGRSSFEGCTSLKAFCIERGEGRFISDSQGLMYNGDGSVLIRAPFALEGTADIPPGVEEVADGAFSGCTGVTSVRISASVRSIGDNVFSGCSRLALLYVDPRNSRYRSDLQGILYDSDVTKVIKAPNSIVGVLEIPDTVVNICANAFEGCTGLVSISIPDSTVEIGDSAFEGCSKVRSISISNGVVRIGNDAFRNCSAIISVTIPDSVEVIGDRAFQGCSRLNSVSIPFGARVGEQAFPANSDIVME
ncbi:MAG: leucine-rich repeat domain-containing protein [Candidatus Methanomethylophilaceae archaeon]|nr:leucine-rich repeat domain-containing protein [Candidatus Methanomethylophilaceae archaeon]